MLLDKIIVTHEGHAPVYLKHELVKPLHQFREQFILPEELVKCNPINGYTLTSIAIQ